MCARYRDARFSTRVARNRPEILRSTDIPEFTKPARTIRARTYRSLNLIGGAVGVSSCRLAP